MPTIACRRGNTEARVVPHHIMNERRFSVERIIPVFSCRFSPSEIERLLALGDVLWEEVTRWRVVGDCPVRGRLGDLKCNYECDPEEAQKAEDNRNTKQIG